MEIKVNLLLSELELGLGLASLAGLAWYCSNENVKVKRGNFSLTLIKFS